MPLNIEGSGRIRGLTDPALDSDAARKKFVEDRVAEVGGGAGGAGLAGTSYVFVAGDGTAAENGTALQNAYAEATLLTPYGNALADDNRAWVIVAPGTYDTTLVMREEFVNVVSLDGDMSIRLTSIDVQADNVLVRGVDIFGLVPSVIDETPVPGPFLIGDDLSGLVVERCRGGELSFGSDETLGENPIVVSGTFTNCMGGLGSFGGFGIASGTFTDCTGGDSSFGFAGIASGTFINCTGGNDSFGDISSGTFTDCNAGEFSFGLFGSASGIFINCTGDNRSFGGLGSAEGTFRNCTAGELSFGVSQFASGTFVDCSAGDLSFGGIASGTFTNCTAGNGSFGSGLGASGTFTDCAAGDFSFGSGMGSVVSGTFTRCTGGDGSFSGAFNLIEGPVLYCRLTAGTFPTPVSGGLIRMSLDGNFNEVNEDA